MSLPTPIRAGAASKGSPRPLGGRVPFALCSSLWTFFSASPSMLPFTTHLPSARAVVFP